MKAPRYWSSHYVTSTDQAEVQRALKVARFPSGADSFELMYFSETPDAPNILISQGSGGHLYIFAELAHHLHLAGYNVFVMPKHGGRTVNQLLTRHRDAVRYIAGEFNETIGVYGEGLGGYVVFYLALGHAPIGSIACQNSPAVMTDKSYHDALLTDGGPWARSVRRRRIMMPFLPRLARIAPNLKVPVSSYLSWKDLVDPREDVERRLVVDGYLTDPDFDRWYPLSAVTSLMTTAPPGPLDGLTTPTMFVVARQGPTPGYIVDLYHRLPAIQKKLVDVDGSVYWMLSHPRQAATLIGDWFSGSLTPANPNAAAPAGGADVTARDATVP